MQHVIVVGGGIIGMLTARELASHGVRVTLLERQAVARESSWAGGGIVSPLYPWRYLDSVTRLASFSQARYPELVSQLLDDTGIDPEFERCGMLVVAPGEEAAALDWARRHAREVARVDAAAAGGLEPALAAPPRSALWMPQVAQVRNPRLAQAVRADLARRGVEVCEDSAGVALRVAKGRVVAVQTPRGEVNGDAVVVCAGAWTGALLGSLGRAPEVHPVRGQMLLFRGTPGAVRRIVLEESRYVIPRRDGRVLFGSTLEHVGFDKSTTVEAYDELHGLATRRFPVLREFPVEHHWAGLRPSSPAGVPYICAHPALTNLFVNAGHYRNGIVLAPASARLLTDLLLQRDPVFPPAPYGWDAPRG